MLVTATCPTCGKKYRLKGTPGQEVLCPACLNTFPIPSPPRQEGLATEGPSTPIGSPPTRHMPGAVPPVPTVKVEVSDDPSPRASQRPSIRLESCLECGKDISDRTRAQRCPDCGSLMCSDACCREHSYHAHAPRRPPPRFREEECPRCGSTARPYSSTVISDGGWIVFAVMMLVCFPLFWIGLLMTETRTVCSRCGLRLR